MTKLGTQNGEHASSIRMISKLTESAIDDFAEVTPEIASFYLSQLALIVEWCATGEWKSKVIPMPEGLGDESR